MVIFERLDFLLTEDGAERAMFGALEKPDF